MFEGSIVLKGVGHFERQWWVIISDNAWVTLSDNVGHYQRKFALENTTYSMTALSDTYEHRKREHEAEQQTVFRAFGNALGVARTPSPAVSKRAVGEYESLVDARAAERSRA
jgi:hypothetical protein